MIGRRFSLVVVLLGAASPLTAQDEATVSAVQGEIRGAWEFPLGAFASDAFAKPGPGIGIGARVMSRHGEGLYLSGDVIRFDLEPPGLPESVDLWSRLVTVSAGVQVTPELGPVANAQPYVLLGLAALWPASGYEEGSRKEESKGDARIGAEIGIGFMIQASADAYVSPSVRFRWFSSNEAGESLTRLSIGLSIMFGL